MNPYKEASAVRVLVAALVLLPSLAWAEGTVVKPSTCVLTWNAPQLNTDGSNLSDLKEYGIYIGDAPNLMMAPVATVPAPAGDPVAGATASWTCTALTVGQKYAQVDAVDTAGNRSLRSALVPFVLADDVSPQAPGSLRIGP